LTADYHLKQAGKSVCVLERGRLGSGDTRSTTAHLTAVTDLRPAELTKFFGAEQAELVWRGGVEAIDSIEETARELKLDCQFRRVPGFLHASLTSQKDETRRLKAEADAARTLGADARFVERTPIVERPGVCFSNQAKFHPFAYLAGLANSIPDRRSAIYERSEASEITSDPLTVKVGKHKIDCDYVIVATHVPIVGKTPLVSATLLQTKLYSYSSYVIRATIQKGACPEVCLWDTSDPYFYLRVDRGPRHDHVIFGGEDHKTGQESSAAEHFTALERELQKLLPAAKVNRRWSGQVVETNDGLPFIGETARGQFVATGFSGNGMTFGTLAGRMACDAALGRTNPWQQLFRVDRKKLRGGALDYITENVDFPYYFLRDRLHCHSDSTRSIKRGAGKVIKQDGQSVACSRDDNGKLHTVSAVCTHLGCLVRWNDAERTWDCPCHGSRFQPDGSVLAGPAETPLEGVQKSAPKPAKHRASAAK
jgi:glycine/D-amino acid oxidase-like deaminating enzyme/nitrite reductase/ring-hydroxylating ferredoxin subunit